MMNKFVIVSTVTDVFLIMCQIFVNATGLWTLLGNNHDLMIMQSWFDENAMKQLTFLTLDYFCISRSGTPSRYTEIHFVNNCLSKKRNRPQKRPPNAKSSNANEVPPHSFCMCYYRKFNFDNNQSHGKRKDGGIKFEILVKCLRYLTKDQA